MFQVSVSQFVCHLFSLIRDDLPDMRKKYLKNLIHICNIKTITFGIGISFTDLISLTSRPSVQMKPVCLPKIVTQLYTAIYCYGKYPYIILDKNRQILSIMSLLPDVVYSRDHRHCRQARLHYFVSTGWWQKFHSQHNRGPFALVLTVTYIKRYLQFP